MTDLTKAIELAEKASEQLQKSHVKQYTRSDGTVVQEHDDSRQKKADEARKQANGSSVEALKGKGVIKGSVFRFKSRDAAHNMANNPGAQKPSHVILGDDGHHWVVSPADAQRLEKHGYEYSK